jgi:hypothetical protein
MDNETVYSVARVYAVIRMKNEMIDWFTRARRLNSEYDARYIASDPDFEYYRNDSDLLSAANE